MTQILMRAFTLVFEVSEYDNFKDFHVHFLAKECKQNM